MRTRLWLPVTMVILAVTLAVTAHLQWRWIRALAAAEEEHEQRVLDLVARELAGEIGRDAASVIAAAERSREPDRMFSRIRSSSRDPQLVAGVFLLRGEELDAIDDDGAHRPTVWPPSLAWLQHVAATNMRVHQGLDHATLAIILPAPMMRRPRIAPPPPDGAPPPELMPPPRPPLLIVQLDRNYLTRSRLPSLARRFGDDFDIAAIDDAGHAFATNGSWRGEHADASAPLLLDSGWRVLVRNRNGSIADAVAATRRHNFYLALHVFALLVVGFGVLLLMTLRAERLRTQQLQFVAGITHELNTPLAALRSAGQNLGDGVVTEGAQVARYGAMIARESARLGDLVAQVLAYSRLQVRPQSNRAPVDVAAVIATAIDETRWLAEQKNAVVTTLLDPQLPVIEGDTEALIRAVQNMIGNAIRHGGEQVIVRASADTNGVAITVEDDGPGVSPADARHLFEPFYRGRDATARGTGLGLTTVAQVARMHGGTINFDRNRAKGAAFTLRIPAVRRG